MYDRACRGCAEVGKCLRQLFNCSCGYYCHVYGDVYRNYDNPLAIGLINIYGNVVNYKDYVTYDATKNTVSLPNHTSSEISIMRVPDGVCTLSNAPGNVHL